MTTLRDKMNEIFTKLQQSPSQIQLKRLQKLYSQTNFEKFVQEFLRCLNIILKTKYDLDPYADKLLVFVSKFSTSLNNGEEDAEVNCPFLKKIFTHLLTEFNNDVISKYSVSQLIKLLLKEISEKDAFLDEDICTQIRDLMLVRIDDLRTKIRIQAIEVLQRLQDPLDNNDIIIKTFIEHLCDENVQVRKHIIQSIGSNIVSIPVIVGTCLDISDEVRLVSFDKLSKIPIRALKIEQRQFILRTGFKDKSIKVRNFIIKILLPQWLSTFKGNYFQFILALKLDADEQDFRRTRELTENVLEAFFKNTALSTILEAVPVGAEKLISNEILWEEIIFWRCLQTFLLQNEEENSEYIDKLFPELKFFCEYVICVQNTKSQFKSEWEHVQHDFIMFELLSICHKFDYSDEVGRNALQSAITTILIDGPSLYDATVLLVKILEKLVPNIEERATKISEIIAEIQTPLTPVRPTQEMIKKRDEQLREYKIKLNVAESEIEIAIDNEDYDKASESKKYATEIKDRITAVINEFESQSCSQRMPKNDPTTLCRCLDILAASLANPKLKKLPESYRAFQELFLPPLFNSKQPEIFWRALRQLCIFANFDKQLAQQSIKVFCAPLIAHRYRPIYDDQTTVTAIKCITDMILIHGAEIFANEETLLSISVKPTNRRKIFDRTQIDETICSEPPPATLEIVIEILSDLLDDTIENIRDISAECLITLIMTGRIRSSSLFSKLLLKWFSPSTAKDFRIRQMIGRLFIDYVPESPHSLETIEEAFLPTLQLIVDAPRNSPLADIDIDSVARFLAALSQPGRHKYNVGLDTHKNIALTLCKEICERPNNRRTLVFLKAIIHLEPPTEDQTTLNILRKQTDTMQDTIKDKTCLRYVHKYRHKLENDVITPSTVTLTSTLPETNTENNAFLSESSKNETETSRYSTLSVKRKKKSKNSSLQGNNGHIVEKTPMISIERINEPNKICRNIVVSETDSDCSQNDLERNKKITVLRVQLHRNEEINKLCSKKNPNNSVNETKIRTPKHKLETKQKTNNIVDAKSIKVTLERNKDIEKMCVKSDNQQRKLPTRSSLRQKQNKLLNK